MGGQINDNSEVKKQNKKKRDNRWIMLKIERKELSDYKRRLDDEKR